MRVLLVSFFMVAVSACGISTFDYEAASIEEREAWMSARADAMLRGFKFGLNTNGRVKFDVEPVKVNAKREMVTFTAVLRTSRRVNSLGQNERDLLSGKICEIYLDTRFAEFGVRTEHIVKTSLGQRIFYAKQSPSGCQRRLAKTRA